MEAASDPIAALATPRGESALAVIRASGTGCLALLAPLFRGRTDLRASRSHTLHHGALHDDGEPIDEVVLGVFRAPSSYTGEEAAEIYCHGGPAVVRRLLRLLEAHGFRPAEPGEFTLRAFLNGKMDLTRAEAVNDVIRARTDRARALALTRLGGGIERRIDEAKDRLIDARAAIEARIEYPDEEDPGEPVAEREIGEVEASLEALLASYRIGRLVQDGLVAVIAGRPNAGKSTLFNLLLREERAIVSETPGTTRDAIEGALDVAGVPVRLLDTAGLRAPRDEVESEGIRRTERAMDAAAVVLYVVDASAGASADDLAAIAALGARALPVWNKIDLAAAAPPEGFFGVSARSGAGMGALQAAFARRVDGSGGGEADEAVIESERQRDRLQSALAALRRLHGAIAGSLPFDVVAFELDEALHALGEITGEVTSDDVLRRMFSRFCVGK